jgi:hypothetical protein
MPFPCRDPAVALKGRFQNGMFVAWQGNGMACVNQTRPHCVNQMGKTIYTLSGKAWHGNGMVWVNPTLHGEDLPSATRICCFPILAVTVRTTRYNIPKLYKVATLYLCVLYGSKNKRRLLPYKSINWSLLYNGDEVFTARYAMSPCLKHICFVFKGLQAFWNCTCAAYGTHHEHRLHGQ